MALRKILFLLLLLFLSPYALSAGLEVYDRDQWVEGKFNGTYSGETDLEMGYHNGTQGLEALWRLNEQVSGSGGEFTDYSSNDYSAVAYGGANTSAEGILSSGAVGLDGTDDYLAIKSKHYDSVGQIGEITVCSWVKSSDSKQEYGNFIASFDRSEYWRLAFEDDISGQHIGWDTTGPEGSTNDLGTSESYADGKWHHVCGWFKAGASPSKKIFVDGRQVASADAHGDKALGTGMTRYGFIGAGSEAGSFNADFEINPPRFNGTIDEVQIFDRALSDRDVNDSYFNGIKGEFNSRYSRRYSKDFSPEYNQDWKAGSLNNVEVWDDGVGLQRLKDVKIGTLTSDSGNWNQISYTDFSSPVVVATVENTGNGNGLISEVRNVGQNSASIRVCDSDGRGSCESSSNHKIHYIAVDADSVNQVDGIEAGTFQVSGEFTSTSESVSYAESFGSAPVPFTTVQTVDGTSGIEARVSSYGSGSFTGGICQQDSTDACNGGHGTETVGWVAIEPGNSPFPNSEVGTTGEVVADSNWNTQSYTTLDNPVGLVTGLTENGGQEVQIDEVRDIQDSQMDVRYCEIESGDSCDTHTEENLGWMAVEPGEYALDDGSGFETSGEYNSKTFDAGEKVYWKKKSIDAEEPSATDFNVSYAVNSSGDWVYYDQFPRDNFSRFFRFNISFSGDGTGTSKINSVELRYSDTEGVSTWQTLTTQANLRENTSLRASVQAIDYSGNVLGQESFSLSSGEQFYSMDLPETEDLEVEFMGNTSNISRSWSLQSFNVSETICDFVTQQDECVMNTTRDFSNVNYRIPVDFVSNEDAKLTSLGGEAVFNITGSADISGLWRGSFDIEGVPATVRPGAEFRPENGDIVIGE
jgi:hypothetical protein